MSEVLATLQDPLWWCLHGFLLACILWVQRLRRYPLWHVPLAYSAGAVLYLLVRLAL